MTGATLASRPAGAAQAVRVLTLQAGRATASLELGCGHAYRLLAEDEGRHALIEQLSNTGLAALVPCEGGLIGNLKVWENLALPLAWQGKDDPAEIEARARAILDLLGIGGERFTKLCRSLPERLSRLECRIVAFTRALLLDREIMVYDRLFEGLSRSQAAELLRLDKLFHARLPAGTSVYLESHHDFPFPVRSEHDLR